MTAMGDDGLVWLEFYNLDPNDGAAAQRFIQQHRFIDWMNRRWPPMIIDEMGPIEEVSLPWHLSGTRSPSEEDLMKPERLKALHKSFVQAVKETRRWADRDTRSLPKELAKKYGLMTVVMGLNAELERAHPRLTLDDQGSFTLEVPGRNKGYITMADIYLSFLENETEARIEECPNCRRLMVLSPKQQAAKAIGKRVYCSVACRTQFLESRPERRRQKVEAAIRSRQRKAKLWKRKGKR